MPDDRQLLDAWRGGDERAGEALFDRHFRSLHGFFRNKVGPECEDLVQRVLLACVERRDGFEGKSTFRTWLFGVARVELLRFYREKGKLAAEVELPTVSVHELDPSPSSILVGAQEERILLAALRRLPLDMQIAVELHYWEQMTATEIAEVLEVPAGTVKSRLRRAREQLEVEIAKLASDPRLRESTAMDMDRWAAGIREKLGS
jgi:RNA polymerase sigma factor (sigma-70 family)